MTNVGSSTVCELVVSASFVDASEELVIFENANSAFYVSGTEIGVVGNDHRWCGNPSAVVKLEYVEVCFCNPVESRSPHT